MGVVVAVWWLKPILVFSLAQAEQMKSQDIMGDLEGAGWKKAEEKKQEDITEADIRAVFNLVDMDKSGSVSKRVKY